MGDFEDENLFFKEKFKELEELDVSFIWVIYDYLVGCCDVIFCGFC